VGTAVEPPIPYDIPGWTALRSAAPASSQQAPFARCWLTYRPLSDVRPFLTDAELRAARAVLSQFQALYGMVALGKRVHLGGIANELKTLHGKIARGAHTALKRCAALEAKRATVPKRVPVAQVATGEVVKLTTERKHLSNLLKMVAYQAEGDLVRMVAPHYKPAPDQGRTLIQSALASAADLEVTDTELRVTLAPLSSAHRTRAVATVCDDLNRAPICFPGTRLRLHFDITRPPGDPPP